MIAWESAIRPPTPSPCTVRKPISSPMFWLKPLASDPARKIPIAAWNMILRPYRSDSLPQIGVDAVEASSVDETTQDSCSWPPSSPTMVGNAVATMVWDSAARSIPSISPVSTVRICRCVSTGIVPGPCPCARRSVRSVELIRAVFLPEEREKVGALTGVPPEKSGEVGRPDSGRRGLAEPAGAVELAVQVGVQLLEQRGEHRAVGIGPPGKQVAQQLPSRRAGAGQGLLPRRRDPQPTRPAAAGVRLANEQPLPPQGRDLPAHG